MTPHSSESETVIQGAAEPGAAAPALTSAAVPRWHAAAESHTTAGQPLAAVLVESITQAPRAAATSLLKAFFRARTCGDALRILLGEVDPADDKSRIARQLNQLIARIDSILNRQLNAILHHPEFQRLEAAWRGLLRLVRRADDEASSSEIKIKLLDVRWRELERDFDRAVDFDQSELFRKVYENEFGTPGGEPFGVLIGDYEVRARLSSDHPHDDVAILTSLSEVAAAAFCPFIASAHPSIFGLDEFAELETSPDLARGFQQLDYLKWRAFRHTEDARFVALTLPRTLVRLPYSDDTSRVDRFCFREEVGGPDRSKYLWGNAAFAFAEVLVRAFADSGWLAGIRGVEVGEESGGLVTGLPVHSFATDRPGVAPKCSTDVVITDVQEKELSHLGFVPLCHCHDTEYAAFYSNESVQQAEKYETVEATRNARISAMLQYTLCVSRFAHYIKAIVRDKIGGAKEPHEVERMLQDWIVQYVTPDEDAARDVKAQHPLREALISVRRDRARPGSYQCVMHFWPHFELDDLVAAVRLTTEFGSELRS